ncbi:MAG TPA: response regulator, partial [Polyangia bacterium]|nr:response regulator [Polyangia bacterium]
MVKTLRILLVEDSQDDVELARRTLRLAGVDAELHVVDRIADMHAELLRLPWDVILSDDRLPDGDALTVLQRVRAEGDDSPLLVLSGAVGEARAVELMAAGIDDIVLKEEMARLPTVVRRELSEYQERRLRRAAEAALNRSEHELREVIDTAPVGICICHGDTIAYANRALGACYGEAEAERLVGLGVGMLAREEAREMLLDRLHAKDSLPIEFPFARHDRAVGTMEITGARQLTFGGLPSVLVTVRDVTEERRLRERLQMADRMAAIGTLAAGIAHEINNPLACVTANLEVLREELARVKPEAFTHIDAADLLGAVDDARQGAERVRVIVRDLKLFARVDGSPRKGPVDLAAVLATAERMTASLLRGRAKLVQERGQLPYVWGDALDLCQVFVNLLANAAQAIEPGQPGDNEIRVRVRPEEQRVFVEIEDTGAGVPVALRSRIFDAFFTTMGA